MYLWDANILRAFGQGHATLRPYLLRVPWSEIALHRSSSPKCSVAV